jgi:enamine deaminase RidA (YjgF/YER057c/UK114 family)
MNDPSEDITERTMSPEQVLDDLGIDVGSYGSPVANYISAVQTGNLLFLAGHGPRRRDGSFVTGRLGDDLTVEDGYDASRITAIRMIITLKDFLGDLSRVRRIVDMTGMVAATADFGDHPKVIDGASDLLVQVFGERGRHARAAIGMGSLPFNTPVEFKMIVEIDA